LFTIFYLFVDIFDFEIRKMLENVGIPLDYYV